MSERFEIWILDPNGELREWSCTMTHHPIKGLKCLYWGMVGDCKVISILPDQLLDLVLESEKPNLLFGFQGNIRKIEMVDIVGETIQTPCRIEGVYESDSVSMISLGFLTAFTTNGYDLVAPLTAKVPQRLFKP